MSPKPDENRAADPEADPDTDPDTAEVLRRGGLNIIGRLTSASNVTFACEAVLGRRRRHCIYKPVAGEQPLWDFPDGTLAGREFAAYLISRELGWNIVPRTVIRDGPAGIGMVQRWVEQPGDALSDRRGAGAGPAGRDGPIDSIDSIDSIDLIDTVPVGEVPDGYLPVLEACDQYGAPVVLVHADDDRLRRVAVFDALVNNADRKGGHVLHCPGGPGGAVYGIDHGICLHVENKLRTVLWGWAGRRIDEGTLARVRALGEALDGPLAAELSEHITVAEIAALRRRVARMIAEPVMPVPAGRHPIPWPAF